MNKTNTVVLWKDIHQIAEAVCKRFDLTYSKIVPEINMRAKHYGQCRPCKKCCDSEFINEVNCKEKVIYLRLHQLNDARKPLSTRTILHTLAHELAHLREWNHGAKHRQFETDILDYMLDLGYEVL
mgnify:CR=1 FL=1